MSGPLEAETGTAGDAIDASPLGKATPYVDHYDAGLLFPIARAPQRRELGIERDLPFIGADMWTGYEFGWLNPKGRPQVMVLECVVPAETPNIVESKSFKLYLNSFSGTVMDSVEQVRQTLITDLSAACGAAVGVRLRSLAEMDGAKLLPIGEGQFGVLGGTASGAGSGAADHAHLDRPISLDRLDIECVHYQPAPQLLQADFSQAPHQETLTSDLLKTNCPVTGQPDWGSVLISYYGAPIDHAGLLQYLVSFRNHNDFHEHCVERIHCDILARCRPVKLAVYARYTRRGGLDINPFRANYPCALPRNVRTLRQ